jgi:hypothetical protein
LNRSGHQGKYVPRKLIARKLKGFHLPDMAGRSVPTDQGLRILAAALPPKSFELR